MQYELLLWLAVLQAAIDDLGRYPPGHPDNAERWFNSKSEEVGSYLWICETLEQNAADIQTIIDNHLKG